MSTNVTFTADWSEQPSLLSRVPVEVLDARLTPTQEGFLNTSLTLDTGFYVARAVLPDGQHVEQVFEVPNAEPALQVTLSPSHSAVPVAAPQAPDPLAAVVQNLDVGDFARIGRDISRSIAKALPIARGTEDAPEPGETWLRTFVADGFEQMSPVEASNPRRLGDDFWIEARPHRQFLQVKPPLWRIAVPLRPAVEGQKPDTIQVRMVARGDAVFPHFVFANDDLELLLRYLAVGEIASAGDLAQSPAMVAERAFRDGMDRPFSTAAGAYIQLQLPQLDRLSWTSELGGRFPWLPDARAIYGEWLARSGRHDEALEQFMEIPALGPPFLSMGLNLTLNRLQQYETAKGLQRPETFAATLAQLGDLARRVDPTRPILTFKPAP